MLIELSIGIMIIIIFYYDRELLKAFIGLDKNKLRNDIVTIRKMDSVLTGHKLNV